MRVSRKWLIGFCIEWGLSRGVDRVLGAWERAQTSRAHRYAASASHAAYQRPPRAALTHDIINITVCDVHHHSILLLFRFKLLTINI